MSMDPLLFAALKAGEPVVHLVTVELPGRVIRWTDGGFVQWGAHLYAVVDADYGALDSIGTIVDGIEEDGEPVGLSIIPPTLESLADLAAADAQGGWVEIHLGAVNRQTGLLIGAPYRLFVGELDQPILTTGAGRMLEYDILPVDARGLEVNEEQRQTHAFRQTRWAGELGDEHATEGTKLTYWREDDPKNSIGALLGRGILKDRPRDNKAIEFTYDPEEPLAFPIGRCGIKGGMRYRVGYGPTNRYYTYFATVGASGPVKGMVKATIDEEDVIFDANDRAINGSHDRAMWLKFLPGDQPSVALTSPTGPSSLGAPAPGWGVNHKLSGSACYAWSGVENSKKSEYGGGLPPCVLTLEGLYGWDPRNGQPLSNRAVWTWMQDGAIAGLNWLIGRWEGASGGGQYGIPYKSVIVGGIGAPLRGIDVPAFSVAADTADANGWSAGGVPYSDMDKADVLEDLLAAAGAKRSRKGGMVSCVSFGDAVASVMTVTEADTAGPVETVIFRSRLERRNVAIGRVLSEEHRWEMTALAPVTNPAWQAADGGRRSRSYDFPYVTDKDQGAQLTYLELAHDREAEGDAPLKIYMLAIEPGDRFDWDMPSSLLTTKACLWRREYNPSNCRLKVKYRTETDPKYDDAFTQTGTAPPAPPPVAPPVRPGIPAVRPIGRDNGGGGLLSDEDSISSMTFSVVTEDGLIEVPTAAVAGLASYTTYGVFYREDRGLEVEAYPALDRMSGAIDGGGFVFLGWQSTSDGTAYPPPPPTTPGSGGTGETPGGGGGSTPSSLVTAVHSPTNLGTPNSTAWVTWATANFANLPAGGRVRIHAGFNALAMTLATAANFPGEWRAMLAGVAIANGTFTAFGGTDPLIDILVPELPLDAATSGPSAIQFQVRRTSGTNYIIGGLDMTFYADWTAGG